MYGAPLQAIALTRAYFSFFEKCRIDKAFSVWYDIFSVCHTGFDTHRDPTKKGGFFMRHFFRCGNFVLTVLLNTLLNTSGFLIAAILVGLHFWLGWSLWWAVLAAGLWLLWIILQTLFFTWISRCANTPNKPQKNKNPYSPGYQPDPPAAQPGCSACGWKPEPGQKRFRFCPECGQKLPEDC